MAKARRRVYSDPTADQAIRNLERWHRNRAPVLARDAVDEVLDKLRTKNEAASVGADRPQINTPRKAS